MKPGVLVAVILILTMLLGCSPGASVPLSSTTESRPPIVTQEIPSSPVTTSGLDTTPTLPETRPTTLPPSNDTTPSAVNTIPPIVSTTPAPAPGATRIVWEASTTLPKLTVDVSAGTATFTGSKTVSGLFFKPSGNGPFPAILMVHGLGGIGDREKSYGALLAEQGYVVFIPDYFSPLGLTVNQFDREAFWITYTEPSKVVLGQALESLKSLTYVSPDRIGVLGFSMGGYFVYLLATRNDVRAAVSYYGAYPRNATYTFKTDIVEQLKAPLLRFQGDADTEVRISDANKAQELMISNGKQGEYIVYPGEGHSFSPTADSASRQKMLAFFKTNIP